MSARESEALVTGHAGRLAGAILLEASGEFFLVGNTKAPCDYAAAGFASPGELDAVARPFVKLTVTGAPKLAGLTLRVNGHSGEEIAASLARRFLITRNGSVSERLFGLVLEESAKVGDAADVTDARWLTAMPDAVFQIVRDAVLRCV